MRDSLSFDVTNDKVMLAYACLLCQLGRHNEATVLFKSLLAKDFEPVKVQLLLSIAYKMTGDMLTSEKFKAQAAITQMREQKRISDSGRAMINEPKASQIMMKFVACQQQAQTANQDNQSQEGNQDDYAVQSQVSYDGQRLTSEDQDGVFLQLSKYLLSETLPTFAA